MQDGEYVTFSEVEGMPELNKGKPFKVTNCKVTLVLWHDLRARMLLMPDTSWPSQSSGMYSDSTGSRPWFTGAAPLARVTWPFKMQIISFSSCTPACLKVKPMQIRSISFADGG